MPINLKELRAKMEERLDPRREYYIYLTDQERISMEITAWNHWSDFGRKLLIAPRLFVDLARSGVNMKYMESNGDREAWGAKDPKEFERDPIARAEQAPERSKLYRGGRV